MPTQFTRRAGLAGAASVVLVVIGAVIFTLTRMSSLNDDTASSIRAYTFVPFSLVGAALFAVFLVGLRRRNGDRFGALGKTAYVVILAAPVLSLAFLWLAPIALVAILSFGFALLAVALYRAAVLPRRAIVVFGIAVPLGMFIALSGILTDALNADVETGSFAPLGLAPFAVGLLWMGWTMWLEPGPQQIIGPGMVGVP